MKRYGMAIVTLGLLLVLGLLRPNPDLGPDDAALPRVQAASTGNIPLPINFRQNQPRHWRYMMLSPGR